MAKEMNLVADLTITLHQRHPTIDLGLVLKQLLIEPEWRITTRRITELLKGVHIWRACIEEDYVAFLEELSFRRKIENSRQIKEEKLQAARNYRKARK